MTLVGDDNEAAFRDFVAQAEPRLRRAFIAADGYERGREATAEALAYASQNRNRLGRIENLKHVITYSDRLPHVLFGDLIRFVLDAESRGDEATVTKVLDLLDAGVASGEPSVVNLIQTSFVENVGPWKPQVDRFVSSWPEGPRTEAERQGWRSGTSAGCDSSFGPEAR